MFVDCCQNEWMCPTTNSQPEFSNESRIKPWTPIDKHSISTGLYDASTTSPDSNGSKESYANTRLSNTQTAASPGQRSRLTELQQLNTMIKSRQRSCSLLTFECRRREGIIGKALLISSNNLRVLNSRYRQQLQQLDRMEKIILSWEKNKQQNGKRVVVRQMRSPTRIMTV